MNNVTWKSEVDDSIKQVLLCGHSVQHLVQQLDDTFIQVSFYPLLIQSLHLCSHLYY